jgi:hypothetical protein
MGLRDAFGVGGGTLELRLEGGTVAPGGTLRGTATFVSGRRAQTISAIKLRFVVDERPAPSVPPSDRDATPRTHRAPASRDVIPEQAISGAFVSEPGQTYVRAFELEAPSHAQPSARSVRDYRVIASADVEGEIDPRASAEVVVDRRRASRPSATTTDERIGEMIASIGAFVLGRWQDGNWYAGRVVATQNGYVGIDWDDARLGASSWLLPSEIRPR